MSLSVFAEVPSYLVKTVALGSLPTFVDTRSLLKDRNLPSKVFSAREAEVRLALDALKYL